MHSNVIRELQDSLLIMKYKLSTLLMHGYCNCMASGFLEVSQHQLVFLLILPSVLQKVVQAQALNKTLTQHITVTGQTYCASYFL